MAVAPVIGETAVVEKGAMLYHGDLFGGTERIQVNAIRLFERGRWLAHAQVIGPIEIGEKAKVGAGAVVVSGCLDVTVVGVPAKIVRVHGEKDELIIHEVEENENII